jgi:hypothetical protein
MSTMTIAPTRVPTRVPTQTHVGRACRDHHRPAATPSQVRLTRRGRLVVFLGALAVVLLLGVFWGAGSVATDRPGQAEPTEVVLVGPGETLWDIAAQVSTDGETGAMVERIQRMNALDSGMLTAGQKIKVPATD